MMNFKKISVLLLLVVVGTETKDCVCATSRSFSSPLAGKKSSSRPTLTTATTKASATKHVNKTYQSRNHATSVRGGGGGGGSGNDEDGKASMLSSVFNLGM